LVHDIVDEIRCEKCNRKVKLLKKLQIFKLDDKQTTQKIVVQCKTKKCGHKQVYEIRTMKAKVK